MDHREPSGRRAGHSAPRTFVGVVKGPLHLGGHQATAIDPYRHARTLYLRLLRANWAPGAAGNMVAYAVGLRPSGTPWTLPQIGSALFLRELVRRRLLSN